MSSINFARLSSLRSSRNAAPVLLLAAAFLTPFDAAAAPPFAGAEDFLKQNCVACHNSTVTKAGLNLTILAYEPADPDNFATWVKLHDRVSAGEMPPAGLPRPAAPSLT